MSTPKPDSTYRVWLPGRQNQQKQSLQEYQHKKINTLLCGKNKITNKQKIFNIYRKYLHNNRKKTT